MTKPMRKLPEAAEAVPACRCIFLLLPTFSPLDLSSAVAALEAANSHDGTARYDWRVVSEDGLPVTAPNGLGVSVDGSLPDLVRGDMIFVCGGQGSEPGVSLKVLGWLRKAQRMGVTLGALGGGVLALARSGLLAGRQVSAHWALRAILAEAHPDVEVKSSLFTVEGKLITCAGGTATVDMMLSLISDHHGAGVATGAADLMVCSSARKGSQDQTISEYGRTGVRHEKLAAALSLMRSNLEEPLTPGAISDLVGLSVRQLERLFSKYLQTTPKVYYTRLRLDYARSLLLQTNMRIIDVALASGFNSQTHFAKVYRRYFGKSPHQERPF
ncbi:GlxA family transcriptional regulator [Leisingera sp. ANG-Vp]|uniref:GlxA family transcriptional regulator n=1 Tax=Leisingera sp. ANG-Vp TaxID=1577896 RepID=UPI00069209A2|nr:GlxA family transcriptional regulator [Leisingera sp. ANG-Vp]